MRDKLRVAAYLVLRKNDQVLLLQRCNTGWEDGNFSLISGHVEFEESPSEAIVREAEEEAGILIKTNELICVQTVHRRCSADLVYIDYFFHAHSWKGEPINREPEKCLALEWHSIHELPRNIIPYVKEVLARIAENKLGLFEYGWEDNNQI